MTEFSDTTTFAAPFSPLNNPRLEFVMEVPLTFPDGNTFVPHLNVAVFDARYLLEEEDGTVILLNNRGFLWGRKPDTMQRLRDWAFAGGEPVPHEEYYLRGNPTFECPVGKHDWLTKHVFVGVGERRSDGNLLRYYALV